jgi:hypothetical protein
MRQRRGGPQGRSRSRSPGGTGRHSVAPPTLGRGYGSTPAPRRSAPRCSGLMRGEGAGGGTSSPRRREALRLTLMLALLAPGFALLGAFVGAGHGDPTAWPKTTLRRGVEVQPLARPHLPEREAVADVPKQDRKPRPRQGETQVFVVGAKRGGACVAVGGVPAMGTGGRIVLNGFRSSPGTASAPVGSFPSTTR